MSRTFPITRNTSGTTLTEWEGLSPLDGYISDVASGRPVQYLESGSTAILATTAAPTFYCKQVITAGMCGRMSAAAAHFQTHTAGANVDNIYGVASWVMIDGGSTIDGAHDGGVITPLSVGVREKVTSTHTGSQVVFGIQAQCLFTNDTPTETYFARLNVSLPAGAGLTALFYGDNIQSVGLVPYGAQKTVFQCPLAIAKSQGTVYYVNCWS